MDGIRSGRERKIRSLNLAPSVLQTVGVNMSAESTTLPEVPSAHFPVKQQLATGDWVVPAAKQAQLGYIVAVAG